MHRRQQQKLIGCVVSGALRCSRRPFVDSPADIDFSMSQFGQYGHGSSEPPPDPIPQSVMESYTHPTETEGASFKLYGETSTFANDDANRIFASGKMHSYDPAVLYADLRLQDVQGEAQPSFVPSTALQQHLLHQQNGNGAAGDGAGGEGAQGSGTAVLKGEEDDTDAVMREGRDKQGAAGAAAVAAAMLETTKARVDGIAMVPGHPLPVVFPRPDGLPPPLRFVKKFGPGGARQVRTRHRVKANKEEEEEMDQLMYGEVMQSDGHVEGNSIQRHIAFQVCVLDEQKRPTKVRGFQHFREVSDAIPEKVMRGLVSSSFSCPTLLQSAALPQLLQGKDVVAVAPNGSGKTIAYAIPSIAVLMKVLSDKASGTELPSSAGHEQGTDVVAGSDGVVEEADQKHAAAKAEVSEAIVPDSTARGASKRATCPVVVVLGPTRESVQRIAAMYSSLAGEDIRVVTVYTAKEEEKQNASVAEGCDVLVSTPSRLCSLIASGVVSLEDTRFIAADEVNKVFEMNEGDSLGKVLSMVKHNPVHDQISLWSPEMTEDVEELAAHYLSPQTVTVVVSREEQTNLNVKQILYPLQSREERLTCLKKLYDHRVILKREQVLIYCAYKEIAEALTKELVSILSAPSSLIKCVHSGIRTRKRNQIMQQFKQGEVRILVGTDIGTRRLDVIELEHVVNYDLPPSTDTYMRRISHVTAGGRHGTAHTFFIPNDTRVPMIARFVEEQTGKKVGPDIEAMIKKIEETGGEDDWSTPMIRFNTHATSNRKWRVRGRKGRQGAFEKTSGDAPDTDVLPRGVASDATS